MTDPEPTSPPTGNVYGQPPSSNPGTPWTGIESTGAGTVYGQAAGAATTPGVPVTDAATGAIHGGPTQPVSPSAGPSAPAWTPTPPAPAWPAPSSPAGYGAYEGPYGTSAPPSAGQASPAAYAVPPAAGVPAKAKRGGGFTTGVALLALLLGLTGVALGVYAVGVARDARTTATGGSGSSPTTQPQPPSGQDGGTSPTNPTGPTDPGAPTTTSTAGDLNPQANFTIKYESQTLLVHPASGCGSNSIDIDIPAVNVGSGGDLGLHSCNNETWQVADGVQLAIATSGDLGPKDCANLIRTSALPSVDIPVSTPNLFMCMTTSFNDAQSQGISWKIALIKQTSVTQDGTASITVTAWTIPQ